MLLSDHDLTIAIKAGDLRLSPYSPALVQPASVDLRLGNEFRSFSRHTYRAIDPRTHQPDLTSGYAASERYPFILRPGDFVLGHTLEEVSLSPALAARLEGKSSLGRLGLVVHSTAGWIDPGFTGQITLELSNLAPLPIELWPGMPIGQLCVMRLSSPASVPYGHRELGSKYQGQMGATPSRVHVDNQ